MAVKAARTRTIRRWRKNMDVFDDTAYVDTLTTLSEGSVRRNFNPYTDIDWNSPDRSPRSGRSRSACGVRPTWPRSDCTSSRS